MTPAVALGCIYHEMKLNSPFFRKDGIDVFDGYQDSVVLYDAFSKGWLLFQRPLAVLESRSVETVESVLRSVEEEVEGKGLWAAGFLSYEAAPAFDNALVTHDSGDFPLLWFGLYEQPREIPLPAPPRDPLQLDWNPLLSKDEYERSFRRVKDYIEEGDTYQVNYSFRLRAAFAQDPWSFFLRMVHAQGTSYGAFVNAGRWALCSASPELFFARDGENLCCRPMKGTAPRGLTCADDMARADWLFHSEKNRAENVMIVDMVRNDLGRIARTGTVEVGDLFTIEPYPTLLQMTSTVRCATDASLSGIMKALFPSASITGAPKVRTMEIIRELERTPRRIYTGSLGYVAPGARAQFNVAIRTVLVDRDSGQAEYGAGGGIVHDSEQKDELQECYTKAQILTRTMPEFSLLETMGWTPDEGCPLLDLHLARLSASSGYFARSFNEQALRDRIDELTSGLPRRPHIIRLLIPSGGAEPVITVGEMSDLPHPYRVSLAAEAVSSKDLYLYHKTTNRDLYERARAASPRVDDVILWNERGEITESTIANVVVERDGRLLTPPVSSGLLAGIGRARLLDEGKIEEALITVDEIDSSTGLFLVNSVRGMWKIILKD